MTMLAEVADGVIGIGTHRDSHEVEIADAAGKPVVAMRVSNDSAGFARLLAAIAEVVPGPRVAVCTEGSRSYGIGLARVLAAAGLLVIEAEQPGRKQRRGKGKSDPIDAHLAVLAALRLDANRLAVPRAGNPSRGSIWNGGAAKRRDSTQALVPRRRPHAGRVKGRSPTPLLVILLSQIRSFSGATMPFR
jgi:transposase